MDIATTIPKNYSGFKNDLDISALLEKPKGLSVITGKNGSGKTQILKFINNEIDNNEVAMFRTTQGIQIVNERRNYLRHRIDEDNTEDFLDSIQTHCRKLKFRVTTKNELGNALFSTNDFYYPNRDEIILYIATRIDTAFSSNKANDFKIRIGYPTEAKIKEIVREEFKKANGIRKLKDKFWEKELNDYYIDNEEEKREAWFQSARANIQDKYITIQSWESFLNYINGLFNPLASTNTIISKLAKTIEDDYFRHKKPENDSILAKINEIFSDSESFKYKLIKPHKSITYELVFELKDSSGSSHTIDFQHLSTGEKALFELLCYQYSTSKDNSTIQYMLLDEFDANFNPTLITAYLKILEKLKTKYKIIITTHSPVTVAESHENEIFELCRDSCKLTNAKDYEGKKKILQDLAPNFVPDTELGYLALLSKSKKDIIIFCEGPDDKFYLEDAIKKLNIPDKYTIIACTCADLLQQTIKSFKSVPMLSNFICKKEVIALFDFDDKGMLSARSIKGSEFENDNYNFTVNYQDKNIENKICVMVHTPPNYTDYSISSKDKSYEIEHLHVWNKDKYKGTDIKPYKKEIKTAVKNDEYKDYSKFRELFEAIDKHIADYKKL